MEFVRQLLVFLHLLGMAMMIGMFFVQLRTAKEGPLNKGWLHGAGLQLVTGFALYLLAPLTHQTYDHAKIGVKITVLVAIMVLTVLFVNKDRFPKWLPMALVGLTVLNVGIAVFWA
ncbi:hypothetical protein D5S17_10950 [Pseudonocardiaceae bacterium YIM PH 21723]|nr:hypothetical protein D5S17_10950 [Pseudonocardiaceae bacterium YIM PH 21723]